MPVDTDTRKEPLVAFRHSLKLLRESRPDGEPMELEAVKVCFLGFVQKLQKRYPFTFVKAYRNAECEIHRQIQERFATHFLFGAIAELTRLSAEKRDKVWELGGLLNRHLGKGGEHFCPHEFDADEQRLAQAIGSRGFDELLSKSEDFSLAMKFKLGPVNSAEHVIAWSFRYVGQLLKSAKWESVDHSRPSKV